MSTNLHNNTFTGATGVPTRSDFIAALVGWHTDGVAARQVASLTRKSDIARHLHPDCAAEYYTANYPATAPSSAKVA